MSPFTRQPWPVAVAVGLLALGACNQILGTKDPIARVEDAGDGGLPGDEVSSPDAKQCRLAVPPGACASCIAASCCDEANACADHSSCAQYEPCAIGCLGDYACRTACLASQPRATNNDIPSLEHCVVANCAADCGIPCGVTVFPQQPDVAQACATCIGDHACDQGKACGASPDCLEMEWCALSCVTPDCQAACQAAYPDGVAKFVALYAALGSSCTTCERDGYWQCVGKVGWPLAEGDLIEAILTFTDSSSRAVSGLAVKACELVDTACDSPVATGTTDAQGKVSLPLPAFAHTFGFAGYFDVSGADIPPYLYFLSFPLSEPKAELNIIVASQARFAELLDQVTRPLPDGGTAPFTPDPNRGTVVVAADDCICFTAAGVTLTATSGTDGATLLRYYEGQTLSNTAAATDRTGIAFFLDVPTGATVGINALPAVLGGTVSSKVSAFARRGAISLVAAFPSP